MFKFIYDIIPKVPEAQQNRIVILKNKLVSFAFSNEDKKLLLKWKNGEEEALKAHPMTVGQKWSTVVKAFTLSDLSV